MFNSLRSFRSFFRRSQADDDDDEDDDEEFLSDDDAHPMRLRGEAGSGDDGARKKTRQLCAQRSRRTLQIEDASGDEHAGFDGRTPWGTSREPQHFGAVSDALSCPL
jgi:hypothetical protein